MGEGSHIYGVGRRATETGYTPKMIRNIVGLESRIRGNKDESLHFFDSKGNKVLDIQGKGAGVEWSPHKDKIPKNAIVTHNHPRSIGKTGIEAIGNSFSPQDIITALKNDAKEIRAVTPTYTFSMKRPKGGWGISVEDFVKSFNTSHSKTLTNNTRYLQDRNYGNQQLIRASTTHYHTVMKDLAKKHKWIYTKTKG